MTYIHIWRWEFQDGLHLYQRLRQRKSRLYLSLTSFCSFRNYETKWKVTSTTKINWGKCAYLTATKRLNAEILYIFSEEQLTLIERLFRRFCMLFRATTRIPGCSGVRASSWGYGCSLRVLGLNWGIKGRGLQVMVSWNLGIIWGSSRFRKVP